MMRYIPVHVKHRPREGVDKNNCVQYDEFVYVFVSLCVSHLLKRKLVRGARRG